MHNNTLLDNWNTRPEPIIKKRNNKTISILNFEYKEYLHKKLSNKRQPEKPIYLDILDDCALNLIVTYKHSLLGELDQR